MGDRGTEGDNPMEYEKTTETFGGGTRTTRTPRMLDSKNSQDANPSEDLTPNIKQRKDAVSRGKPNRKKTAGLFDSHEYKT